jgi:hypothetical protein
MRLWKESLKEQWSKSVFQKETPQQTAEANSAALGQIELLNELIELDELELHEALTSDE